MSSNKSVNQIVLIKDKSYNPYQLLADNQNINTKVGAQSIFIGYMRDFREQNSVDKMTVIHYEGMTEYQLSKLAGDIITEFNLIHLLIAHRVGQVSPTEALVTISATASHRSNAIEATKKTLEVLKHNAPFWKKESNSAESTASWVDKNTENKIT